MRGHHLSHLSPLQYTAQLGLVDWWRKYFWFLDLSLLVLSDSSTREMRDLNKNWSWSICLSVNVSAVIPQSSINWSFACYPPGIGFRFIIGKRWHRWPGQCWNSLKMMRCVQYLYSVCHKNLMISAIDCVVMSVGQSPALCSGVICFNDNQIPFNLHTIYNLIGARLWFLPQSECFVVGDDRRQGQCQHYLTLTTSFYHLIWNMINIGWYDEMTLDRDQLFFLFIQNTLIILRKILKYFKQPQEMFSASFHDWMSSGSEFDLFNSWRRGRGTKTCLISIPQLHVLWGGVLLIPPLYVAIID